MHVRLCSLIQPLVRKKNVYIYILAFNQNKLLTYIDIKGEKNNFGNFDIYGRKRK